MVLQQLIVPALCNFYPTFTKYWWKAVQMYMMYLKTVVLSIWNNVLILEKCNRQLTNFNSWITEWVLNVPLDGLDFNVWQKGKASNLKNNLILLCIKSILKSCYPCNLIGSQFIHKSHYFLSNKTANHIDMILTCFQNEV